MTRIVDKVRAGLQDLLFGPGQTTQTRGNTEVTVDHPATEWYVATLEQLKGLPVSARFAALVNSNTSVVGYYYDSGSTLEANDETVVMPNIGTGRWLAKPIVTTGGFLGDFVLTGLLPADSATLSSDISAGQAFVNGQYLVRLNDTTVAYEEEKDTYVDFSAPGVFTITAVDNGDPAPSLASGAIRLAIVVTDDTEITSVTDSRQLNTVLSGGYMMPDLPTSDPSVAGVLWNNSGVLTVSAG